MTSSAPLIIAFDALLLALVLGLDSLSEFVAGIKVADDSLLK